MPFEVIAHRGGWGPSPQNTLPNFDAAIAAGVDANELDVRRTADGVLVVHHDAAVGARLISLSRYADLRLPDGSRVPRFIEAVALHAGRSRLDVELKEAGYEAEILRQLDAGGMRPGDYVTSSFEIEAMVNMKRLRPTIYAGLLVGASTPGSLKGIVNAKRAGLDFIAPDSSVVDEHFLSAATAVGLGVIPWTPWAVSDEVRSWQLLKDPRIGGVIVNQREAAVAGRNVIRPRETDAPVVEAVPPMVEATPVVNAAPPLPAA